MAPATPEDLYIDVRSETRQAQIAEGFVYAVVAEGTPFVKIGFSRATKGRRRDIQVGCPYRLKTLASWPGGMAAERLIQRVLQAGGRHVRGEWFSLPDHAIIAATSGALAAEVGVRLFYEYCMSKPGGGEWLDQFEDDLRRGLMTNTPNWTFSVWRNLA
jgi:Meiotically Up-regulated Gene 113 (MUG113) protein